MLTHHQIRKDLQPGRYFDGNGLHLRVSGGGTKVWILRITLNGVSKDIQLGPYDDVGLAEARKLAKAERDRLKKAGDLTAAPPPKREKKVKPEPVAPTVPTFDECWKAYIEDHRAEWSPKHAENWRQTLQDFAHPKIGTMPVSEIARDDVLRVVKPIWTAKNETANRVLSRIRIVLGWAKAAGYRTGDNPAAWKDNMSFSLADRNKVAPVKHHEALPFREIPDFIAKLRASNHVAARAMLFLILTAARSSEARGATWGEVDLTAAEWTIPPTRMKAGKEHRVPLAAGVVALIGERPKQAGASDLVFPSNRVGKRNSGMISNMSFGNLLDDLGYPTLTTHGFRSTFRDWAAETTEYANEVVEMALAHAIGSKVEAAYRRGNLLEKRRKLMEEWTRYCFSATVAQVNPHPD